MDLSDDEDFYDSDQSDIGDSLHAMLKKTLYDKNSEFDEYGAQTVEEEEALGSVQEEVLGKVLDNEEQEEVLGPVSSTKDDAKGDAKDVKVNSDESVLRKLDEAEEVTLDPKVMGQLENKHYFEELDNDDFEPLSKKQKVSHDGIDENPHKTIVMHVPQFIRCSKGGQSIQVQ